MRDLKTILRVMLGCLMLILWCTVTVWLGARVLCQIAIVISRWRWIFARELPCGRGHTTPAYGVFECRCGALVEDWVFARCRVCGQTAGWTPCTTCGLPIQNPLIV